MSVDHELDEELVVPKVQEIAGARNVLAELPGQDCRIGRPDTERDHCPDIVEDGFSGTERGGSLVGCRWTAISKPLIWMCGYLLEKKGR